jgi:glycosyltransferase involved in cell wall biosynthesis
VGGKELVKPQVSILISSYNRLPLLRRVLWGVATRPPSVPFEVIVVDDGSTEPVLNEVQKYSSAFPWTFVRFSADKFKDETGVEKFWNCPAATTNVAARRARGDLLFVQGNECIAVGDAYDCMIRDMDGAANAAPAMVMSTTYDAPLSVLWELDDYGTDVTERTVQKCLQWPLQSKAYRSDVTNYLALFQRKLWDELDGVDERYVGGIAAEDSDFVRRARKLGAQTVISDAVSLHQYHGGRTAYYEPTTIDQARYWEGVKRNRAIYDAWDGETCKSGHAWEWGTKGIVEAIVNV